MASFFDYATGKHSIPIVAEHIVWFERRARGERKWGIVAAIVVGVLGADLVFEPPLPVHIVLPFALFWVVTNFYFSAYHLSCANEGRKKIRELEAMR